MRIVLYSLALFVTANACWADDRPKASGTLDGKKITFHEKSVVDGAKATTRLLESCHDESRFQADELTKAKQGDHIRLAFDKPTTLSVMGEKVEVSELVLRLPTNTGVFWMPTGDKWRRYSKYEFQQEKPFAARLREAQSTD